MKKVLLLIVLLFISLVKAQNIDIPNYNFATNLNGWTLTGNNVTMSNSNSSFTSGVLSLENTTFNDETFVITSSLFPLFANDNYVFFAEYGYYTFDAMSGALQLGQLSSVVLRNSSGTIVQSFNLTCGPSFGGPGQMDFCESSPFLIDTTDSYYLELSGLIGNVDSNNGTETYNFGTINLYKDNSPHSIQGKVTYDENADNCVTSTYTPTNIQVKSTASSTGNIYFSNTNSLGNYGFTFDETGSVTTEIPNALITSNPVNYSNTFTAPQTISNQNFCINSTIAGPDVEVVIVPTTDARPGFNSAYSIVFTNNGDTATSGSIDFSYDNTLVNHLSSSPTEDASTLNSLSWNYLNLLPFETRVINVFFNINTPPTVNNGDILLFDATINPIADANPANNTFNLQQITIGSYDPNDATVLQGPFITSAQAADDLYFRIRFQNTGTASAININVNTVLDTDIDWSTFMPIYGSHNYTVSVNGGVVNFKFDNINLADSTSDEPNSHGLVVFKAKTVSGFAVGDIVECKADIYFDYNLPIITNTATTQINPLTATTYVPDDNFEARLISLGYDSGPLDDYVLTANINTLLSLNAGFSNISDLTGLEDFVALESLTCSNNNLTSLDVTNNIALKTLLCNNNQLTTIDLSQNPLLEFLSLNDNMFEHIDISGHPNVDRLNVSTNNLLTLNVKNGNNTNFVQYASLSNPNLTCIEVDDASWSSANWSFKDAASTYVNNQAECATLSNQEFTQVNFNMYPNPVNNMLTISMQTEASYSLITVNGQVIKQGKFKTGENILDTSSLSNGLYFIQVKTNEGLATKKIIKQ